MKLINLNKKGDDRGALIVIEEEQDIPIEIKRVYYMFNTKLGISRGFHAHKQLTQIAITVNGTCKFLLDDGHSKETVVLDSPSIGLVIEPMVWHEMHDFSDDCILMVLADDHYDESDYIRDYELFISKAKKQAAIL
ncbi:sugar 3,4-ketoisomerase [Leclercia adecarboxylata]|uniref:sugar 3,4-ketoisomerase n=1 Tax=Leclercia adecarboxylata TaxID=83655 RepID=UPI00254C962A|nr:FdtA/QdtA family cupin domain-containing protein [Leclercia adecarboxylata]MDU1036762.1 FdtA/QdtA family cupin domain-containing protein [Staphylococcus sp.]